MLHRAALAAVAAASLLLPPALLAGGRVGTFVFAAAVVVLSVGLAAIATTGPGSSAAGRRAVAPWLGAFLLALGAGMAAVFALSGSTVRLGGLPAPTAVLLYGLALGVFVLTTCGYLATFATAGVREEDLARLAALARERRGGGDAAVQPGPEPLGSGRSGAPRSGGRTLPDGPGPGSASAASAPAGRAPDRPASPGDGSADRDPDRREDREPGAPGDRGRRGPGSR